MKFPPRLIPRSSVGLFLVFSILLPALPVWCGDEAAKVREVVEGIIRADNEHDLERILSFYSADAVLFPPGETEVKGKSAIRPRYERLLSTHELALTTTVEELEVLGRWAYVRGRNGGELKPLPQGPKRELNDRYVMILRKQKNGEWKITRLMWQTLPPATAKAS